MGPPGRERHRAGDRDQRAAVLLRLRLPRSQYEYFGLDVDTIGLTTQGFIMRSPQPLLVPLLVLSMVGASAVLVNAGIRRRLTSACADPEPGSAIRARRWTGRATAGGLLLMAAGFVLLLLYPLLRDWPSFNLITPLVIALGGSIATYAIGASRFAGNLESVPDSGQDSAALAPGSPATPLARSSPGLLRPAVSAFILVAVAASIFWAAATVAQWIGVGLAQSGSPAITVGDFTCGREGSVLSVRR